MLRRIWWMRSKMGLARNVETNLPFSSTTATVVRGASNPSRWIANTEYLAPSHTVARFSASSWPFRIPFQ